MKIRGTVALVTGANRGLGKAFAAALRDAGAAKVYGAARDPAALAGTGLRPVRLDITRPEEVAAAAAACGDVNLLINNAGVFRYAPLIDSPSLDAARAEMETNYFGTLAMCRAFAPVLGRNGGGALVNVLSVASWIAVATQGSYCASKAAQLMLTDGVRIELRAQGTLVVGVHAGYIDTDMVAGLDVPKARPADVVARTLAAIEAGAEEVLADQRAVDIKAALRNDPGSVATLLATLWAQRKQAQPTSR
ncbi:MAG: SDR family oxidoreductase [Alphaproteobacteria bacterium]|nr:SDR family oxidoreductase [Alphaproteobacteria bacterium]